MDVDSASLAGMRDEAERLRDACARRAQRMVKLNELMQALARIQQQDEELDEAVSRVLKQRLLRQRRAWIGLTVAQSLALILVVFLGQQFPGSAQQVSQVMPMEVGLEGGPEAGLPKVVSTETDPAPRSVDEGSGGTAPGPGEPEEPSASAESKGVADPHWQPDVTVKELPFEAAGTTAGASSRRIDAYDCAPNIDEGGAEVWYAIDVPKAGILVANIPENMTDGIDVDIHLLNTPTAAGCMVRGNSAIRTWVEARRYWLVVDTYVSDGVEKAGAYHVSVDME